MFIWNSLRHFQTLLLKKKKKKNYLEIEKNLDSQVPFPEFLVQWVSMYIYSFPDYSLLNHDREALAPFASLHNCGNKEIILNY